MTEAEHISRPTQDLSRWQMKYLRAADPTGRSKRFYHAHPERRRYHLDPEATRESVKSAHYRKRAEAIAVLGGPRCVQCGYDKDPRALQIDHIDGGGAEDRRRLKGSAYNFYRNVIQWGREKYQVLCANCNYIKRYDRRECRQYTRKEG